MWTMTKNWLIKKGTSLEYGVRPLARVIQRYLLNPLSRCLLEGTILEAERVIISLDSSGAGLVVRPDRQS